jgi:hypothetical protein
MGKLCAKSISSSSSPQLGQQPRRRHQERRTCPADASSTVGLTGRCGAPLLCQTMPVVCLSAMRIVSILKPAGLISFYALAYHWRTVAITSAISTDCQSPKYRPPGSTTVGQRTGRGRHDPLRSKINSGPRQRADRPRRPCLPLQALCVVCPLR